MVESPQPLTLTLLLNNQPVTIDITSMPSVMHHSLDQTLGGTQHPLALALTSAMRFPLMLLLPTIRKMLAEVTTQGQTPFAALPPLPPLPPRSDSIAFVGHYVVDALLAVVGSGEWHVAVAPDDRDVLHIQPLGWSPASRAREEGEGGTA
ncbi:MAG: hypothetical protein IVW55_12230 [Chloroflexi bacterium]|nr:hypothetical protein [Chloroflexota bacterium]